MSNEDKWNNEEAWDCVADGPLSPRQLAELVAACEERPELWKRCALALLEEQTLRYELQSLARESLSAGKRVNDLSMVPNTLSSTPLPCPAFSKPAAHDIRLAAINSTPAVSVPRAHFWNNLALVATVMIAFGIGWQASRRFGFTGSGNYPALVDSSIDVAQNSMSEDVPVPTLPADNESLLAGSDGVDPEVIDQVNAETLATAMQVDWKENLDPEYEHLRRQGYKVESHEGLIPVWLYDGSSAVVPYQQIKVHPKSQGRTY